jgi:hypothetical protein
LATIPIPVKVKNDFCLAYWAVDLAVDPAFRRQGLAVKLVSNVNKQVDLLMTLGSNLASYRLFKKLNWLDIGKVPHMIKILNVDTAPWGRIKKFIFKCLNFFSVQFIAKVYNILKAPPQNQNIKINEIVKFDEKFNLLWQRLESKYLVAANRDVLFLNWRYASHSGSGYTIFQANTNGVLSGYIVLKIRYAGFERTGIIIDILSEPDSLDYLVKKAIDYFLEQKVSRIDCFISDKESESALIRQGFFYWRTEIRLVAQGKVIEKHKKLLKNVRNWRITAGDSDLSIYV